eukprot:TRINITY_DN4121_c0_g1_i11.p2 TRINITY_DN4121_c0_g1~~TRINITY_DN4121_c0_g1_i11.p2  ORF type:complete len:214 (-),score=23.57 TRINITY_DN4121_c0_g1_i11:43-684(-)
MLYQVNGAISYTKNNSNNLSQIYIQMFKINIDNCQLTQLTDPSNQGLIQYGRKPQIKIYNNNNKDYILSIFQDTTCSNGVSLNNNGWNKCRYQFNEQKYQTLLNVKNSIGYYWGKYDSILKRAQDNSIINGCDLQIMWATVYNGNNPGIALIQDQTTSKLKGFVYSEFVNTGDLSIMSTLYTGASSYAPDFNSYQANQLYNFTLLDYDVFDYL